MTLQFRKSKTSGPFRATLSKQGVGVSAGAGPLRYSLGADGKTRRTVRVPGTSVYATQVVGDKQQAAPTVERKRHPWLIVFAVLALLFLLTMILI